MLGLKSDRFQNFIKLCTHTNTSKLSANMTTPKSNSILILCTNTELKLIYQGFKQVRNLLLSL